MEGSVRRSQCGGRPSVSGPERLLAPFCRRETFKMSPVVAVALVAGVEEEPLVTVLLGAVLLVAVGVDDRESPAVVVGL